MERKVGTISRGIRGPIIRQGDNLVDITVSCVLDAAESEGFSLRDRDVIALTESIVARAQGNYASVEAIAAPNLSIIESAGVFAVHSPSLSTEPIGFPNTLKIMIAQSPLSAPADPPDVTSVNTHNALAFATCAAGNVP